MYFSATKKNKDPADVQPADINIWFTFASLFGVFLRFFDSLSFKGVESFYTYFLMYICTIDISVLMSGVVNLSVHISIYLYFCQ